MAKKAPSSRIVETLHQAYALHQQNRIDEAWILYERILASEPKLPDALHLSGCVASQRGDYAEAARRIGAALSEVGPNALYLVSYGNALAGLNRHGEAEAAFRNALALDPGSSAANNNLGNLLVRLGRYEEAMTAFDQALLHAPRHLNALLALGHLLADRDALGPSLELLRRARAIAPDNEKVLLALGKTCCRAHQYEAAMEAIEAARRLKPDSAEAHTGAGTVLGELHRYAESIASFRRALELEPQDENALNGLIKSCAEVGQTAEAIEAVRRQVLDSPTSPIPQSSLLFLLNYLHDMPAQEVAAEHHAWNARFALPIATAARFDDRDRDAERKLRIGYVSADFRTHSVSFFLEPIFEHHDRDRFEIYAYHNATDFDAVTQRLKASVSQWREVRSMSDQELAALIRADGIDILIDLGGHTAYHRLLAFARRPAPVQMTYLGYPNTTGLTAIQYRISDAVADPPGIADQLSAETLLRLPDCFHCYRPADGGTPDFTPPSAARGYITFGSFNVVGKINPDVIAAWAGILGAVPGSRLLLKTRAFGYDLARAPVEQALAACGIAGDRIMFSGHQESRGEHMARYREVDIALDTFPYNGTTTTCDALWMGVPVVTLRGDRHSARVGASLLHACGLDELIAADVDGYVATAIALATDSERLARLHSELRERLRASPLMDEPGFTRSLEAAYRGAWRRYCDQPGGETGGRTDGAGAAHALAAPHWTLRLAGAISVCVPAAYAAMTPSVLLEQEDWFEAEIDFVRAWLQPGMEVIDIGANYGIYALNAARRVGAGGRVWAFEPAPNTRRFLAASVAANGFDQVRVEAPALSDTTGEAWMQLNWNPELNSIVDGPQPGINTERIAITTLDAWQAANPEARPDFIKMDAEGHERKILAGGRALLERCAPLVMFELKHAQAINHGLVGDFEALGFGIYRLVPGLGVLTPFSADEEADAFALNLFACKPELAATLAASGLLAATRDVPGAMALPAADAWCGLADALPCFAALAAAWRARPPALGRADMRAAIGACAEALRADTPAERRLALLGWAQSETQRACNESPRPCRLHTLARIAWMRGEREVAINALRQALAALDRGGETGFDDAFLPAAPRFDAIAIDDPHRWLEAATIERFLQLYRYAGYFADPHEELPLLERAAALPHFSAALERRRQLLRIRAGQQSGPQCSPLLAEQKPGNLNPAFWCP